MSAAQQLGLLSSEHLETLVLYTYSNSDTEYERNLHYFVEHGMADGDGCDYVIIVQEVSDLLQTLHCTACLPDYSQETLQINPCAKRTFCMIGWPNFGHNLCTLYSCQCVLPCWTQCLLHDVLAAQVTKRGPSIVS